MTYELSTFYDPTKCMTYDQGYVNCNGTLNQQFKIPSNWLPGISTNVLHSIRLNNNGLCFDSNTWPNTGILSISGCSDKASQQFVFDSSTHQIKQGGYCLDHGNPDYQTYGQDTAFMNPDCQHNLTSQVSVRVCLHTPSLILISYELKSRRCGFMMRQPSLSNHSQMTTV